MNIEEVAFKDRKNLAQLNELDLLDIIEFLQKDRKEWINQFTKTHNESVEIQKENQELKQKLNWIAFGDDQELALRYLRKIGYVDFDEERKVYINKHNNEPFLLDDEEEKGYYIPDEELNEYTKQLEYQLKELKKQLEECYCNRTDCSGRIKNSKVYNSLVQKVENQQKSL